MNLQELSRQVLQYNNEEHEISFISDSKYQSSQEHTSILKRTTQKFTKASYFANSEGILNEI